MQRYTPYFIWKLLFMFRVVLPPIIRSAYKCIYSIWCLSHRYCYLPLSWKSWDWFECAVGGVRHPQHTQTKAKIVKRKCLNVMTYLHCLCCTYRILGWEFNAALLRSVRIVVKTSNRFVMSVCTFVRPSVCLRVSAWFPLDGFKWN